MEWYYAEDRTQKGPFTEAEFRRRVDEGLVGPETLVWNETLTQWTLFRDVDPFEAVEKASESYEIPESSVVAVDPEVVVAGVEYADFAQRASAKIMDYFIVQFLFFGVMQALGVPVYDSPLPDNPTFQDILRPATPEALITILSIGAIYEILFLSLYSATPGKMAFRIKVIFADGRPMSPWLAARRYLCELVSQITLYLGYLIALFDKERATLHDRMCGSRVIKSS